MLLAAAIAPWAVVIVSSIWAVWYYATSPRSTPGDYVFPDPTAPWEFVALFSLYGIPTAYLSLGFFLPLYFLARHFKVVSYLTMIAAGLLTCLPAALFYGRPDHVFVRILVFLLPFGAAIGMCFHWIMKRCGEPCAPPNGGPAASLGNSGAAEGPPSVS